MATASAKAIPSNIGTNNFPAASGLRPIASMAFEPISPMLIAGAIPPIAIVKPFVKIASVSASIKCDINS